MGTTPSPNLHAEVAHCEALLQAYAWPGNVRELRNCMERVALSIANTPLQAITPAPFARLVPEIKQTCAQVEPRFREETTKATESLTEVMEKFHHNRESVAKYLGISRTTLWRKLRNQNIADIV